MARKKRPQRRHQSESVACRMRVRGCCSYEKLLSFLVPEKNAPVVRGRWSRMCIKLPSANCYVHSSSTRACKLPAQCDEFDHGTGVLRESILGLFEASIKINGRSRQCCKILFLSPRNVAWISFLQCELKKDVLKIIFININIKNRIIV